MPLVLSLLASLPTHLPAIPAPTEPAAVDVLELVPEDAFFVLRFPDLDGARKAAGESAWSRFLRDEDVEPFVDHLASKLAPSEELGGWGRIEQELGMTLGEIGNALDGSCVLYFGSHEEAIDERAFAGLTFVLGEERAAFHELLDRALAKLDDEMSTAVTTYSDVEIVEYYQGEGSVSVFVSEMDDVVTITAAAEPEDALVITQTAIARRRGEEDSLGFSDDALLRAARSAARSGGEPHVELFTTFDSLWSLAAEAGDRNDTENELEKGLEEELRGIRWLHATGRIGEDEAIEARVSLSWPTEGILGGFAGFLGAVPTEALELMPREATSASALSYDANGAFELYLELLEEWAPDEHEQTLAAMQAMVEEDGLDVRGDLLAQLTGGFGDFTMEVPAAEAGLFAGSPGTMGVDAPALLTGYVIGLRDSARVQGFVEQLLETSGLSQKRETEEFQGFQIHSVDVMSPFRAHWAFTSDHALLCMGPTPVRTALRLSGSEDAPSVLDNEKFEKVIAANRDASALSVTDTASSLRTTLKVLPTIFQMLPLFAMMTEQPELASKSPFGPDTPWPDPAVVDRYFDGVTFSTFTWDGKALSLRLATR